jgi:hypothetical protein
MVPFLWELKVVEIKYISALLSLIVFVAKQSFYEAKMVIAWKYAKKE